MPNKPKQNDRRNLAALSPLLKKGGFHKESKSGKRRKDKNALKKEVNRLAQQGDFFMGKDIYHYTLILLSFFKIRLYLQCSI